VAGSALTAFCEVLMDAALFGPDDGRMPLICWELDESPSFPAKANCSSWMPMSEVSLTISCRSRGVKEERNAPLLLVLGGEVDE
jgi:hypothetical protein